MLVSQLYRTLRVAVDARHWSAATPESCAVKWAELLGGNQHVPLVVLRIRSPVKVPGAFRLLCVRAPLVDSSEPRLKDLY